MNIEVNGVTITLTKEQLAEIERQNTQQDQADKMEQAKNLFLEMFNGCTVFLNQSYPNLIFYKKDGKVWFEQDFKNKLFWCSNSLAWSIFETKFDLNYEQIKELIGRMLEERLGMGSLTPRSSLYVGLIGWKNV